jgi:hypothetical protein
MMLMGGAVVVAVLVLILGMIALNTRGGTQDAGQFAPGAGTPNNTSPPWPSPWPTPSESASESAQPDEDESENEDESKDESESEDESASEDESEDQSEDGEDGDTSEALPPPRLVGPKSFAGFETLLNEFCEKKGTIGAHLLEGSDGSEASGTWICLRMNSFFPIRLDDPCREAFGEQAKARKLDRRDSRTWRCFDR